MTGEMTLRAMKALADPTRFHIVELLSRCCCGSAAVRENGDVEGPTAGEICCHITGADKITSTVSHHLHELEEAGLINLEKRGKSTVCTLNTLAIQDLSLRLAELSSGGGEGSCC